MKPIKSPPGLFTFNGIGTMMYGNRAADPATGTYIKTRWLTLVYLPVFPIDSYRVANAPGGGWYFLGKEKVSSFARSVRWVTIVIVLGTAGSIQMQSYRTSPQYLERKGREKAEALVAAGKPLEAAKSYQQLIGEGIGSAGEWRGKTVSLIRSEIASGDPRRAEAAIRFVARRKWSPGSSRPLVPDLADLALAAASGYQDPAAVESVLSSFDPSPTDVAKVHQARRAALEKLHESKPQDPGIRVSLALIREEFGETAGALELLEPAAATLGSGEGARLYGNLLLEDGRLKEAIVSLENYVGPRIAGLRDAERKFQAVYDGEVETLLEKLDQIADRNGFRGR